MSKLPSYLKSAVRDKLLKEVYKNFHDTSYVNELNNPDKPPSSRGLLEIKALKKGANIDLAHDTSYINELNNSGKPPSSHKLLEIKAMKKGANIDLANDVLTRYIDATDLNSLSIGCCSKIDLSLVMRALNGKNLAYLHLGSHERLPLDYQLSLVEFLKSSKALIYVKLYGLGKNSSVIEAITKSTSILHVRLEMFSDYRDVNKITASNKKAFFEGAEQIKKIFNGEEIIDLQDLSPIITSITYARQLVSSEFVVSSTHFNDHHFDDHFSEIAREVFRQYPEVYQKLLPVTMTDASSAIATLPPGLLPLITSYSDLNGNDFNISDSNLVPRSDEIIESLKQADHLRAKFPPALLPLIASFLCYDDPALSNVNQAPNENEVTTVLTGEEGSFSSQS